MAVSTCVASALFTQSARAESSAPELPLRFSMKHLNVLIATLLLTIAQSAPAEDWPEFRGPTGQGHYAGKGQPIEWSTTKNVVWKQPIPGKGWSSPIVQDGRV